MTRMPEPEGGLPEPMVAYCRAGPSSSRSTRPRVRRTRPRAHRARVLLVSAMSVAWTAAAWVSMCPCVRAARAGLPLKSVRLR